MNAYIAADAELIRACVSPEIVPPNSEMLFLIYAVLLRAKGVDTTAEDVHDAWSAWRFGTSGDHRSIRPLPELAAEIRAEDLPFLDAIRRVARSRQTPISPSAEAEGEDSIG